jgi:hypothetical protein
MAACSLTLIIQAPDLGCYQFNQSGLDLLWGVDPIFQILGAGHFLFSFEEEPAQHLRYLQVSRSTSALPIHTSVFRWDFPSLSFFFLLALVLTFYWCPMSSEEWRANRSKIFIFIPSVSQYLWFCPLITKEYVSSTTLMCTYTIHSVQRSNTWWFRGLYFTLHFSRSISIQYDINSNACLCFLSLSFSCWGPANWLDLCQDFSSTYIR